MARGLVVGNWKAYIASLKEAKKLFKDVEKALPRGAKADVVICPPAPFLYPLAHGYGGRRVAFGAQDAFYEAGHYTGEAAPQSYKDAGASYVIVGHSEKRASGDTDEVVAKKLTAVLAAGLTPILCVGEKERDREATYLTQLEKSILASLSRIEQSDLKKIIIAYEPVWAVGATTLPSAREIRETIIFIRKVLSSRFAREVALKARIIYGGDVNAENIKDLIRGSSAAGFLVGRASVDAAAFSAIVRAWS